MIKTGKPFANDWEWQRYMLQHSEDVVPDCAWGARLQTAQAALWPILRTIDVDWTTSPS